MNIARFEPWTLVDMMHRDLDRLVGQRRVQDDSPVTDWVPAVDILEENDRFVLRADVPGVAVDDIDVSMDAGVLNLSGERRAEERGEEHGIHLQNSMPGIADRHFRIRPVEGEIVLEDLSGGSTVLNDQPFEGRRELAVGDRVRIGSPATEFLLISVAEDGA